MVKLLLLKDEDGLNTAVKPLYLLKMIRRLACLFTNVIVDSYKKWKSVATGIFKHLPIDALNLQKKLSSAATVGKYLGARLAGEVKKAEFAGKLDKAADFASEKLKDAELGRKVNTAAGIVGETFMNANIGNRLQRAACKANNAINSRGMENIAGKLSGLAENTGRRLLGAGMSDKLTAGVSSISRSKMSPGNIIDKVSFFTKASSKKTASTSSDAAKKPTSSKEKGEILPTEPPTKAAKALKNKSSAKSVQMKQSAKTSSSKHQSVTSTTSTSSAKSSAIPTRPIQKPSKINSKGNLFSNFISSKLARKPPPKTGPAKYFGYIASVIVPACEVIGDTFRGDFSYFTTGWNTRNIIIFTAIFIVFITILILYKKYGVQASSKISFS